MKVFFLLLFTVSAFAQWQDEISEAHKKETCEIAKEKLELSDTVEECLKSDFFLECHDWCMHNMSNGDITFENKGRYWGRIMINRDNMLERNTFYGKKFE